MKVAAFVLTCLRINDSRYQRQVQKGATKEENYNQNIALCLDDAMVTGLQEKQGSKISGV